MDKNEALKLALEVLEEINKLSVGENAISLPAEIDTAMDAIKEALAQPEQESDDLTIAYMAGFYDGKNKDAPQPEQEPVAWLTKELMANYLDTIAEAIEANRSEMLRHKAHKLRDRGEV